MIGSVSRRAVVAGMVALPLVGTAMAETRRRVGSITRLDPALDRLIDPAAPIEVVADGLKWAEGPVWVRRENALLFTDPQANILWRWTEKSGAKPFLQPSGLSGPVPPEIREPGANGTAIDASGALVLADSGTRQIARVDLKTRKRTVLADRYQGKRFNSCNDVAIHRSGAIYFTDPPYGLREGDESKLKELPFNGVFRRLPNGEVELISDAFSRPNGVALSPQQDRLYISQSDVARPEVVMFRLDRSGKVVGGPELFHDTRPQMAEKLPGLPDGMKVDAAGNVFATGPGGVHVVSPQGKLLGIIGTGKSVANCAFGEDGRTLFLTSSDMVARVRVRTRGW